MGDMVVYHDLRGLCGSMRWHETGDINCADGMRRFNSLRSEKFDRRKNIFSSKKGNQRKPSLLRQHPTHNEAAALLSKKPTGSAPSRANPLEAPPTPSSVSE